MRILYHHRTLGDGAEGIHIAEMVNAFREIGHDVRVVSPIGEQTNVINKRISYMSRIKKIVPKAAYELMELGYNIIGYYILSKAIREFRPDIIYDRYITFNASSIIAGKHFKIPTIIEVNAPLAFERQNELDENLYLARVAHYLERWICANAHKTIVVSTPLKEYLKSVGVPADKIVVIPNGVNLNTFKSHKKDIDLLHKLGIDQKKVVFGFVGILRPWHGLDLLIDAFAEISRVENGSHLLIIGDGPIRTDLEDRIKALNLEGSVTITGRIEHNCITEYINVIDIAVSPMSTFYASPMKILEYMALRKSVIAPDMPNIQDIICDSCEGLLFKPGDKESLVNSMLKMLNESELRDSLATNARNKVEQERNWRVNAQTVVSLV